jgi:hypothetical protein
MGDYMYILFTMSGNAEYFEVIFSINQREKK